MAYVGVKPAAITSATEAEIAGDLTVDTNTLKVDASSDRVGVNNASPDTTMKVNFSSASTAGFGINDTNSGNLGGMLQFYSGAGNGTLRGNIQNANNAGVHFALGTGSVTFDNTGYVSANALDDYEEGTWTATLEGSTTNPSSTVQTTSARYTKVGRQVFAQGQFSNVDTTGAAGAPRVTGLPFSASTSFATGNVMLYSRFAIGTTAANVSPYVAGTTIFFYQSTNVQGWAEVAHSAGTGAYFAFTVVYDV